MTLRAWSWFERGGRLDRSDFSTQLVVLVPVLAIAGLTGWMMASSPSSARSQSAIPAASSAVVASTDKTSLVDPTPDAAEQQSVPAESAPPQPEPGQQAVTPETSPLDGLKIASQAWRRGGLGSKALVTFTLRNNNDYAVKDIEIACAFARRDGSHLTDRTRVIRDTVNMKSRKTFARMLVGFVNVNASKAKCSLVTASRA